jgi:hypothetical protein
MWQRFIDRLKCLQSSQDEAKEEMRTDQEKM